MPKTKPAYLLHKPTGQARVRIDGRDTYFDAGEGNFRTSRQCELQPASYRTVGIVPSRSVTRDWARRTAASRVTVARCSALLENVFTSGSTWTACATGGGNKRGQA